MSFVNLYNISVNTNIVISTTALYLGGPSSNLSLDTSYSERFFFHGFPKSLYSNAGVVL
jgi:hypothetical protein